MGRDATQIDQDAKDALRHHQEVREPPHAPRPWLEQTHPLPEWVESDTTILLEAEHHLEHRTSNDCRFSMIGFIGRRNGPKSM
jgi:hypothetical protein